MIEHSVKAQMAELRSASTARQERLRLAREKELKTRGHGSMGAFRVNGKRAKITSGGDTSSSTEEGDEQFLPDDKEPGDGDGVYLSSEVRDLMAKYVATSLRPVRH